MSLLCSVLIERRLAVNGELQPPSLKPLDINLNGVYVSLQQGPTLALGFEG